jgi:DNA primase
MARAPLDITTILSNAGIGPLRVNGNEVHAPCPMHMARTGAEDRHPSWSINSTTYVHLCFSCGYKGTLNGLLLDVTGSAPEDLELRLNEQSFVRKMETARQVIPDEFESEIIDGLTEWELYNLLTDVPQRLLDHRMLQRAAIDTYEVRWSAETRQWVMPLRLPDGALIGAQYRQKGSVLTLPEGVEKSVTLFGFHQCREYDFCAIVESPLDAVRLFGIGVPAVSSLGAWVSKEQVVLLARNFTSVYLAMDDDKTGHKSCEIVAPMLRRAGTVPIPWDYEGLYDDEGSPAKDPGDVADDAMLLASWERTSRMGL